MVGLSLSFAKVVVGADKFPNCDFREQFGLLASQ